MTECQSSEAKASVHCFGNAAPDRAMHEKTRPKAGSTDTKKDNTLRSAVTQTVNRSLTNCADGTRARAAIACAALTMAGGPHT